MRHYLIFLLAFLLSATFLGAQGLVRSGWTTTGDAATARAALGVTVSGTNAPGGADTMVQYNDAGSFGGLSNIVHYKATGETVFTNTIGIGHVRFRGPVTHNALTTNTASSYFNASATFQSTANFNGNVVYDPVVAYAYVSGNSWILEEPTLNPFFTWDRSTKYVSIGDTGTGVLLQLENGIIGTNTSYTFLVSTANVANAIVSREYATNIFKSLSANVVERSYATPLIVDALTGTRYVITNRISGVLNLVFTNGYPGVEYSVTVPGEASGGTSRVVTMTPELGHLVADMDTYGIALATTSTLTLTNGNKVEINWLIQKENGTNIASKVSRQASF